MTQGSSPLESAPPTSSWRVGEHEAHVDPLLDCLAALTKIHGTPWTREALAAGLPLVDNLLPPSQFHRAASRAGLSSRLSRVPLVELAPQLLPAVLLLRDRRACLLLERLDGDRCRVHYPESGEAGDIVALAELAQDYEGIAVVVRPRFRFDARTADLGGKVRSQHWFWGAVRQNWRLYRDTLLAAFLVNLFALAVPLFSMNVYDRVVPNQARDTLWVLAIGVMAMLVFDFVLRSVRGYIVDTASKRIDVALSALIMERVLGIRMAARPASAGSFAANFRAFETVRDFITSASMTALIDLPFVLVFLLAMVWISPWLVLPPVVVMAVVVISALFTQEKMTELTEVSQRASAQRNATLIEVLVSLETIKTTGAESTYQRRWEQATLFLAQIGAKTRLLSSLSANLAQLLQQLCSIMVVIVGVYLAIDGQVTMGGIIAASMLSGRVLAPLGLIAGLLMQYQQAKVSLAAVESHMQLPVERPEGSSFLHRAHFRGDIEFRNVEFAYPGQEMSALRGVSLQIRAGERVAIIGRIGSGKSTLEKLILGLYQPDKGAVLVDGIDARQIDPAELRRAVGYVPQDPQLLYGSLRENIATGAPFATDDRIVQAAELAGVAEFANAHPKGFDLVVAERGESLSGGQRQAVAVARAVLGDPPILLLDEPTSAMDHQSEDRLKKNLARYAAGKTVILVTHRTSLLDLVDRLIVIDGGQVVADGPKAQVVEALQQGRVGRGV